MYERALTQTLLSRLAERAHSIQVVTGPRQVGKTTLVRNLLQNYRQPNEYLYLNLDDPTLDLGSEPDGSRPPAATPDLDWLVRQWTGAREQAKQLAAQTDPTGETPPPPAFVLVLDEIQQIPDWSRPVKGLWDTDRAAGLRMHVVVLGSTPLLMQQGLNESLAGRFELLHMTHWSYQEMREAFGVSLEEYVYFGGLPANAELVDDPAHSSKGQLSSTSEHMRRMDDVPRWKEYVKRSLINPNIQKDIIMMRRRIDKPALLTRVFNYGCLWSGQTVSLTKIAQELQDAGNVTTVAEYLDLLDQVGLLAGLQKYSPRPYRRRGSVPKLMVYNTALMSASSPYTFERARADGARWGRLAESAVGSHLLNSVINKRLEGDYGVCYWRENGEEVDFVLLKDEKPFAIEVKSGARMGSRRGLDAFTERFEPVGRLVVGEQVSLEEFLLTDIEEWFA